MTSLAILIIVSSSAGWTAWLVYCYAVARSQPRRAAGIIRATGRGYPFPGRGRQRARR